MRAAQLVREVAAIPLAELESEPARRGVALVVEGLRAPFDLRLDRSRPTVPERSPTSEEG